MHKVWMSLSSCFLLLQKYWTGEQRSLSLKLTLVTTSLVIAAVGSTTVLSIQREQRSFRAELEQQANLLLNTLDVTLRDPLYRLDIDLLTDFMGTLGQNQEFVSSGYLYDERGRLLANAESREPIYELDIDPLGKHLVNSPTPVFDWQQEELVAGRAIIVGNRPVGAIRVGLSTAPLQQKIATVRNRGISIAVIASVISIVLAQWISRSITQPLQELVRGTQQIARGNFQLIQIQTVDELSILAAAFNDMSSQLQQTLSLLEQHNEDLETRVQLRTRELTQTLHELQETQAQLLQSEKMSSLGQLVAGIAHEINNPVNFIHGNLNYIQEYTQDLLTLVQLYQESYPEPHSAIEAKVEAIDLTFLEEDLAKILRSVKMGTERIREIVVSLRNFSRLDEADVKMADLHDGLDSTLLILQHRLKATPDRPAIQIHKDYGNLPQIACYPGQLNQVFMNILANAIDALDERSEGHSYKSLEENPNIIEIQTQVTDPQWLTIVIKDNGPGVQDAARSSLFDPFFTTKPVGKGTGLGLSISYRIITEKHGGTLACDSIPGQETKFVIKLPIQETLPDWAS